MIVEVDNMDKLSKLIARVDIQDVLYRYARAVDRRDWDSVRTCYHDGATDEHGEYSGDVDGFIAWVSERHAKIPFAAHFLGNCLIEFLDERIAFAETYFVSMHRRPAQDGVAPALDRGANGEIDSQVIGRYLDRFELRDGAWRIAARCVVYDSSRLTPSTHKWRNSKGTFGTRNQLDPVFTWVADLRTSLRMPSAKGAARASGG